MIQRFHSAVARKRVLSIGGLSPVAGMALWLKASSLALADNDPVATWPDLSGNGFDAAQATSGFRPVYKAGILNGKAVVRFDGDDILQTADIGISQPDTIIVVGKIVTGSITGRFVDSQSAARQLVDIEPSAGFTQIYAGGAIIQGSAPPDLRNAFHLIAAVFNAGASQVFVDGQADSTGNPGTNGLGAVNIGSDGSTFMLGDIAEILIYPTALSDPDRGAVEAYLAAEYAL